MTAIRTLLAGLFDYAGLYPPASLSLRSAANNYLAYTTGKHAEFLGRFIINANRLSELREIAGESLARFELSVIVSEPADLDHVETGIRDGILVEALEFKGAEPEAIREMSARAPRGPDSYFEMALSPNSSTALQALVDLGFRAKIRMGGVKPDAFPSASDVVRVIAELAKHRLPFKATAGLHHPIRSCHPLTYDASSATGVMHGFINLLCAASVLYFGGDPQDAEKILLGEDSSAWQIQSSELQWRHLKWTEDQLSSLRRDFITSIGSCSFEEPIRDLEALGWL